MINLKKDKPRKVLFDLTFNRTDDGKDMGFSAHCDAENLIFNLPAGKTIDALTPYIEKHFADKGFAYAVKQWTFDTKRNIAFCIIK